MRVLRFAIVILAAALFRTASAQPIPPPLTATVINFDDIVGAPDNAFTVAPVLPPGMYASQGVIIAGFGTNGGAVFNLSTSTGDAAAFLSPPNALTFVSITTNTEGGLVQSPETLSFYPPITSFQFDSFTAGVDCTGTSIVTSQGFDADGNLLGTITMPIPETGTTLAQTFPAPGATTVVITSSHACGVPPSPFAGLELFTMDNIAFVRVGTGVASKCGQGEIDAAGKKAKAEASCYSKALQKGVPVDANCIQKAVNSFNGGITKAQDKGDCLVGGRHGDNQDVSALEAAVDNLIASSLQLVNGGAPGPDICAGKKMASIGKKAQSVAKCWSKAAQTGAAPDEACAQKAAGSFNGSLKTCGTPTQLGPVEFLIDQFADAMSRAVTVPTTTTTTTTSTTTTTTQPPPLPTHLSFTTTPGSDCTSGGAGPFSGELFSDTGLTTPIFNLGLGCLYIGGGTSAEPPTLIPENATSILNTSDGVNLVASLGTSRADCTAGPQPSQHCVNNPAQACSTDADCAGFPGACAFDATCFFGPPVPVNGFPTTCVVNTFAQDASGTVDLATGDSSISINLASRVFLSIGLPTPCPECIGGTCNYGDNIGQPCTTNNVNQTSLDCLPGAGTFVATLPVNLTPLTNDTNTQTAADGIFCPGQTNAGAFGQSAAEAISQTGAPGGDLTDNLPHPSTLVSIFCIPSTNNASVDGIADLPGPGSISLPGNAQYVVVP
jgi:hypothetical protein